MADILGSRTLYDALGRAIGSERLRGVDIAVAQTAPNSGVYTSAVVAMGERVSTSATFYDAKGRTSHSVDALGNRTDYVYDQLNRQVAVVGPVVAVREGYQEINLRHRVETVYDNLGRAFRTRDNIRVLPNGTLDDSHVRVTESQFDAYGRVVKVVRPDNTFTTTSYDSLGRRTGETDALGRTTNIEYDGLGRMSAVVLPAVADAGDADHDGNTAEMLRPRYAYGYDARGNMVALTDPLGRVTRFAFDEQGRQIARTLPLGVETTGDSTDWTETKSYDEQGRLAYEVSFEGVVTSYVYDQTPAAGERLVEKRFYLTVAAYANGVGTPTETVAYAYDALGRMKTVTDPRGTTTYAYDIHGNVVSIASPEGVVNQAFDPVTGNRTAVWTDNTRVGYGYDHLGRLASVTEEKRLGTTLATPAATTYRYDLLGRLDEQVNANDTIVDYRYDNMNRVEAIQHLFDSDHNGLGEAGFDPVIAQFDYTYLADGNRDSATESFNTDGDYDFDIVQHFNWQYDAANRLTQEAFDAGNDGPGSGDYETNYGMDLTGNRVAMSKDEGDDGVVDVLSAYTYDNHDRILTETTDMTGTPQDRHTTYDWNMTQQAGKTVHEGLEATGADVASTAMEYNLQGRLARVSADQGGAVTVSDYAYNDSGMRVEQAITADGVTTTTRYVLDASNPTGYVQVLEETNAAGTITKSYTLGLDVLTQATIATGSLTLAYDAHGSTRALLDSLGAIAINAAASNALQLFTFDAYGVALGFDASISLTTLLYSGEQTDPTGMQYLRARYYDAASGRFDRLDPYSGSASQPQSFHKYLYTHANPVGGIDPGGSMTLIETSVSAGITGAIAGFVFYSARAAAKGVWNLQDALISVGSGFAAGVVGGAVLFGAASWGLGAVTALALSGGASAAVGGFSSTFMSEVLKEGRPVAEAFGDALFVAAIEGIAGLIGGAIAGQFFSHLGGDFARSLLRFPGTSLLNPTSAARFPVALATGGGAQAFISGFSEELYRQERNDEPRDVWKAIAVGTENALWGAGTGFLFGKLAARASATDVKMRSSAGVVEFEQGGSKVAVTIEGNELRGLVQMISANGRSATETSSSFGRIAAAAQEFGKLNGAKRAILQSTTILDPKLAANLQSRAASARTFLGARVVAEPDGSYTLIWDNLN